jgi:hypothetical protein
LGTVVIRANQKIEKKDGYSNEEFAQFEVLTSRYARTTDMLVNKVLRSIDTVELEDIGTVIDIMNRAEKCGIVSSAELLHTIKDLKNNIVHEYKTEYSKRYMIFLYEKELEEPYIRRGLVRAMKSISS